MASASERVEKIPVTTYEERCVGVNLSLSITEAITLAGILRRIGGAYSAKGMIHKKNCEAIRSALTSVGYQDGIEEDLIEDENRSIYFK